MRASTFRNLFVAFLLLVSPSLGTAQTDQLTLSDFEQLEAKVVSVVDRCMAASVGLGSKERPENGSAVVVSKEGLLLTAYHVVEGLPDNNMIVSFNDGTTARAKKLGGVPKLDIAVAQIIDEGEYHFAEIGDMDEVQNGDWCISIAHAGGFQSDRTPPVRLGRVVNRINGGGFLQMTSTLIGGDSGGPTFDLNGKVIGIHSNIGGSLTQNQACPISDFTKDDHWQRLLDGEVWGKPGESNKKKKKKSKDDDKEKDQDTDDKKAEDKSDEDADDEEPEDQSKEDSDSAAEQKEDEVKDDKSEKQEEAKQEAEEPAAEENSETQQDSESDAEEKEASEKEDEKKKAEEKKAEAKKQEEERQKLYETSLKAFKTYTQDYRKSIVRFWRRGRMICSGLILSRDGVIVTKSSELMSRNFEIELPGGELVRGKVLKRVKENDLLFVKVDRTFKHPIDLTQTEEAEKQVDDLPLGSIVVAIGFGGEPVAMGVKSVKVRNIAESGYAVLGVQLGNQQNDLTIKSVTPNSAAKNAGLMAGDVIKKIGGDEIKTLDELREKLRELKPNSRVPVEFERDGRVAASLVKLGSSNARNDKAAQNYPQGGRISRKRTNFTEALQSDTPFGTQHVGGPLIDIRGQLLGLNIARAGRIKSYTLPLKTISKELIAIQEEQRED